MDWLRRKWNWCRHGLRKLMTLLPNKHYGGHCRAAEEKLDQRTPGERNVVIGLQVKLEEDGGSSTGES